MIRQHDKCSLRRLWRCAILRVGLSLLLLTIKTRCRVDYRCCAALYYTCLYW